jgi:hypothetical protein
VGRLPLLLIFGANFSFLVFQIVATVDEITYRVFSQIIAELEKT